jgi:hypothetical protein
LIISIINFCARQPSPALLQIITSGVINSIFDKVLQQPEGQFHKTAVLNGIDIILEFARCCLLLRAAKDLCSEFAVFFIQKMIGRLDEFHEILKSRQSETEEIATSVGVIKPLGEVRLKVLRILFRFVQIGSAEFNAKLAEMGIAQTILVQASNGRICSLSSSGTTCCIQLSQTWWWRCFLGTMDALGNWPIRSIGLILVPGHCCSSSANSECAEAE